MHIDLEIRSKRKN